VDLAAREQYKFDKNHHVLKIYSQNVL